MASNTLTFDLILQYFLDCGGYVRNKDAVTKFRKYLTHPECKEESRQKFREYVNVLAHSKVINGEKILLLKSKYMRNYEYPPAPALNVMHSISPPLDPRNSLGIPLSPTHSIDLSSSSVNLSPRQPPPYRPPPPVSSPSPSLDNVSLASFNSSLNNDSFAPQPPPRKRSMDIHRSLSSSLSEVDLNHNRGASDSVKDEKEPISVKERTQKFNRLASVEDELNPSPRPRKSTETKPKLEGEDNEDVASIASLEPKKCVEWYVTASKGDFQELIKLAKDEPRLVHKKDPFTTVLHWGAKHGNSEIIKHFAGHHKVDVNGRTGYTPLHIAAQFGHKDVFKLLIEVYKANQNLRDYSGRTPEYYFLEKTIIGSKKNLRKTKGRKKQTDKDLGFLRMGSLNVRVKKTTEAFSNFLGVGTGSINPLDQLSEKLHKGWGSADNVQENLMPAPKGYVTKKKSKRSDNFNTNSTPTTPRQTIKMLNPQAFKNDSDSDTAAGFDSQWKNK